MTINNPPKEMPTGDCHPTAGNTINGLNFPTALRNDKVFSRLRAAFAWKGHMLRRTDPADGLVTFWAERWGLVRHLPTIDTARQFLEQIGGRL